MNLKDQLTLPIFKAVADVAQKNKIPAYVVGGFVRDLLLGRPCKDVDFVCVGSGMDLAAFTAEKIDSQISVNYFKNFGTAHFRLDDFDFEFVGARKESYQRDSRNPIVEAGTLEDDQNRRDFTINALAISLNKADFGLLLDPFNGIEDLEKGIIQTPLDPDITFSDDPLRMMRAIRFATQLNFFIEEKTLTAIERNADRIRIISQERITDELNKIILSKKPSVGFRLLDETGLLKIIFPEMDALKGVETVEDKSHKDNFYHTLQVLDNVSLHSKNLWLRWAAILHDIAKPPTKRFDEKTGWTFHGHEVLGAKMIPKIFRNFKLPMSVEMKYVQQLVYLHLRPIALTKEEITDAALRRLLFEAGDNIDDLLKLCEADITSKNKAKVTRYLQRFDTVRKKLIDVEARDQIRNFQPPIDGNLIMKTFVVQPGKEVGIIKEQIKEAILEGKIPNDYDAAYSLMMAIGESLHLVKK